jgi:hypothetical protein
MEAEGKCERLSLARPYPQPSWEKEETMFRHPKYLEIPWEVHWQHEETESHHHLWWLIALLLVAAIFMIGVGVTSGINS